jgi:hypothetical protein
MRQYLSSLVVIVLGVACGGTTDTGSEGDAGSASGGSSHAGTNQGGSSSAGAAGRASAGRGSGGSSAGSVGTAGSGGTLIIGIAGTGTGGTGIVNPKCPAHKPMGMCSADDAGTACEYEPGSGCLCYPTTPGSFTFCQKVDPNCVFMAPAAAGAGGVSAKIALPPHEVCSCLASAWSCTFGI